MDNGWITLAKVKVGDHVLTSPATGKLVQFSNGKGSGTLPREVTKIDKIPQGMGNAYVLRFAKGRHTEERYGTTHVWLAPPEVEPKAEAEAAPEVAPEPEPPAPVEPPKPTKPVGIGETEARYLIDALTAVMPMATKDPYLPILGLVKFETDGDELVLVATDRFVLGSYRIPWDGGEVDAALGLDECKELLAFCRKVKPDVLPVGLKFGEREVEVDDGQRRSTLLLSQEGAFVNWRAVLPERDPEDVTFGVNLDNVARFVKAGGKGEPPVARVSLKARLKPVLIEVGERFTGLVMPVRLPDEQPADPATVARVAAESRAASAPIEYRTATSEDGTIAAAEAGKPGSTVVKQPDGRVFVQGWDKGAWIGDTSHGWRIRITAEGQVLVVGLPADRKPVATTTSRPARKRVELVDGKPKVVACETCKGFGYVRKFGENKGHAYKRQNGANQAWANGSADRCPSCSASVAAA